MMPAHGQTNNIFSAMAIALIGLAFSGHASRADDLFTGYSANNTSWQGGYLGVHGGAGLGTAGTLTTGGTLLGLHGGINFQSGQLVGGSEADFTASQVQNSATNESFKQDWMGTGRVRGGFTYGNLLTFGTAGLAIASTRYTNTYSTNVTNIGWVYGGGVEAMILPHVALRGELLHYSLGSESYLNSNGSTISLDTQSNIFRFGIDYKF
jgi:outer membrane immunogenic protein